MGDSDSPMNINNSKPNIVPVTNKHSAAGNRDHSDNVSLKNRQAAEYLGLSESSLRQDRMNGPRKGRMSPIPFYRLGRAIRYRKAELDEWLKKHRVDFSDNDPILSEPSLSTNKK